MPDPSIGVGSFTIVDEHSVTAADTGNNFFLTVDSIGQVSCVRHTAYGISNCLMSLHVDGAAHLVPHSPGPRRLAVSLEN